MLDLIDTSTINSTHAAYGEADHARIAFFRSHLATWLT